MKYSSLLLLLALLLAGCPAALPPLPPTPQNGGVQTASEAGASDVWGPTRPIALGEIAELAINDAVEIPDAQLRLRFDWVKEDSRCPADVSCAWSGIVDVQLTVDLAGSEPESFVVGGMTDGQGNVTGPVVGASGPTEWWHEGYAIELQQVLPYPARHDKPTQPADYRIVVVITTGPGPTPEPTAIASPTPIPFPEEQNGLPILCLSEKALVGLAAGTSTEKPAGLTPPVTPQTIGDEAGGDSLCILHFGDEWEMAESHRLPGVWADFLPDASAYWVWDAQTNRPAEKP